MTSDPVRQKYQEKLGPKFGAVFKGLLDEWALGRMRTNEFRELFSSVEDVGLLNAISDGGFISDVQHIFWDDLMLRLCRLTDRPETAGKENLTIQKLPDFCQEKALRCEVESLVKTAVEAAEFARPWRNKRISHADLARAITPNAKPMVPATLQQVEAAFDAVHSVLNTISGRLLKEEIANHVVVRPRSRAFLCYAKQLVEGRAIH